jgi:hypothetical protein
MASRKGLNKTKRAVDDMINKTRLVDLDTITLHPELQIRVEIDQSTVGEYKELMHKEPGQFVVNENKRNEQWPPLELYVEGKTLWLVDGWHRYLAAQKKGYKDFQANIISGTFEDAKLAALYANSTNGLRRNNEDKRNAVKIALQIPELAKLTDRALARKLGISGPFVGKIRKQLELAGKLDENIERVGLDGRVYNTKNIGAKPKKPTKKDFHIRKPKDIPTTIDGNESIPDVFGYNPVPSIEPEDLGDFTTRHKVMFFAARSHNQWNELFDQINHTTVYITPKPRHYTINDVFTGMNHSRAGVILCRGFVGINDQNAHDPEVWIWGGEGIEDVDMKLPDRIDTIDDLSEHLKSRLEHQ